MDSRVGSFGKLPPVLGQGATLITTTSYTSERVVGLLFMVGHTSRGYLKRLPSPPFLQRAMLANIDLTFSRPQASHFPFGSDSSCIMHPAHKCCIHTAVSNPCHRKPMVALGGGGRRMDSKWWETPAT